jgi:hypothetical protein
MTLEEIPDRPVLVAQEFVVSICSARSLVSTLSRVRLLTAASGSCRLGRPRPI